MTRPLVHFEIRGRDLGTLRSFYARVFGWNIGEDTSFGIVFVEAGVGGPGDIGGAILRADEPRVVIYVQVLDLNETLALAESLGGRRVLEPLDVPGQPTIAQIADPEGNIIGLVQQ